MIVRIFKSVCTFKCILYTDWHDLSWELVFYYFPLETKSVYKTNIECSFIGANYFPTVSDLETTIIFPSTFGLGKLVS